METIMDLLDRARLPLNDAIALRYTDATLLSFANAGIQRAIELRPDLRFGKYSEPLGELDYTDEFPFPYHFFQTIADYVTGRAQLTSDVAAASPDAVAFAKMFENAILH